VTEELDIVIPVYNEGGNIIRVLDSLREHVRTSFRILICYDHDEDDTIEALRRMDLQELALALVKNRRRGVLGAILTGFEESRAPSVLVFPADDDYNAPNLDRMVEKFRDGCEIVAASRFLPGGCMTGCPWLKAALVRSSAWALHYLARVPTHDPSNGFRLFSRRVLETVPIESTVGFAYSIELLVKCHRLGWKIGEVPVSWHERKAGRSRFRVVRWLPQYLRWFFYAFATTYLRRGSGSVTLKRGGNRGVTLTP
jgi:dolichol-phosphate mannosyltransferase